MRCAALVMVGMVGCTAPPPGPAPASVPPAASSPVATASRVEKPMPPAASAAVDGVDGGGAAGEAPLFSGDPAARALASDMYKRWGVVAGLEKDHRESMGWRGTLHLVPALPVGRDRHHLEWIHDALEDIDETLRLLEVRTGRADVRYRFHPFVLHFMRSVGRTTPSAYAIEGDRPGEWIVAYNVVGSLNTSASAVRELLVHELFHRNDADDGDWSERALLPLYRRIVAGCRRSRGSAACLAPYSPTTTRVRGGTYYAFQPEDYDPVLEYAAELALRWYREQRAIVHDEVVDHPFKCGPPENAEAWRLIRDEMFGGIDQVPDCASAQSATAAFDSAPDGGRLSP